MKKDKLNLLVNAVFSYIKKLFVRFTCTQNTHYSILIEKLVWERLEHLSLKRIMTLNQLERKHSFKCYYQLHIKESNIIFSFSSTMTNVP